MGAAPFENKTCLELLLREERYFPQTRRIQQFKETLLESIEIENSYSQNFPFTVELQYDIVELTEKSEGSEVIDISDDNDSQKRGS